MQLPWHAGDIPLLLILPACLILSAFFSGTETAMFSLRAHDRQALRSGMDPSARAISALLREPRMLLISLLLGNMTANVLYFVVSSVLLLRIDPSQWGEAAIAGISLLMLGVMIVFGDVAPKLVAASRNLMWARNTALVFYGYHQFITPVRSPLSRFIIEPLGRLLIAGPGAAQVISHEEIESLLSVSRDAGIIDADEHDLLQDVADLTYEKARDVMTPRVRLIALPVHASRAEVLSAARQFGVIRAPVYGRDLDDIVGIADLRRILADEQATVESAMEPPTFVPEQATLDHLLSHFRATHSNLAIVVDEFGQTAGTISVDDVAFEIIGGSPFSADQQHQVIMTGIGKWIVDGSMGLRDFIEQFELNMEQGHAATLSGYIVDRMQRVPCAGDLLILDETWAVRVLNVRRGRVQQIELVMQQA